MYRIGSAAGRAAVFTATSSMLDRSTGEVLDALEQQGVSGRTIVIFTSDNGPWLDLPGRMLQGGVEPWHTGSPGPLRGWKATTYEGGVRVPAILRWPGRAWAGRTVTEVATAMDLYVTLVEAAGAQTPSDRPIDGINLLPLLQAEPVPRERTFYYFNGPQLEAVRQGDWKLRVTKSAGVELFDLGNDPAERYNRASSEADTVTRLEAMLRAFEQEVAR
jgi:arylsulfatase A